MPFDSEKRECSFCVCYESGPTPVCWGEIIREHGDHIELRDESGQPVWWSQKGFLRRGSASEARETFERAVRFREALDFVKERLQHAEFAEVMDAAQDKFGRNIRRALESVIPTH
jgi:hypothetical protein